MGRKAGFYMAENQDELEKYGQPEQRRREESSPIQLLTIIGEVEGHECLAANSKTTKYEHVIPVLAAVRKIHRSGGCWC